MKSRAPELTRWSSVSRYLSERIDLDASARAHGALVRRRGVRSAADLLHLALLYGPGGMSLRTVASFASEAGIADVCDVSLLDRLRNCGDWLAFVLSSLLAHKRGAAALQAGMRLALVDGSTISGPGSKGSDWRVHARYDPGCAAFTDLAVTSARQGEALDHLSVSPGDVVVHDRGYGRARNLAHAVARGAHFITRIGWRATRLVGRDGAPFDMIAALPEAGPETVEFPVAIEHGKTRVPARLIIKRKAPEAADRECRRRQTKARDNGQVNDPRTLKTTGYMLCLTSLPACDVSAEAVIALYRMRWQIELAFKRLKSIGGFDELRANDHRLVRTWMLAHLIAAVLIETSLAEELDSPP